MSSELEFLSRYVVRGKLSRRDFLGRAAALGASAAFANSLLSSAARAEGPVKGGTLKAGLQGGESTNSLDPATFLSQVPFAFGKCWGETLVELAPDFAKSLAPGGTLVLAGLLDSQVEAVASAYGAQGLTLQDRGTGEWPVLVLSS